MTMVDQISNLSDLVHAIETRIKAQRNDRGLLIREAFIVWYMLSEGGVCERYSEKELMQMLKRNFEIYRQYYSEDTDYTFLTGWMMHTAFWFFRTGHDEGYGNQLMMKAWGKAPGNSLFKWAVRWDLGLEEREINRLQRDIQVQFNQYFNYGPVIRRYFLEIVRA